MGRPRLPLIVVAALVAGLLAASQSPAKTEAFSGQNGKIAFVGTDEVGSDIFIADAVPDADFTLLTHTADVVSQGKSLDWSPDGSRILFIKNSDGAVWVIDADGSNERKLITPMSYATAARWSPDGARIAYSDAGVLKTTDADGKHPVVVGANIYVFAGLAWSPDGSEIVFSGNDRFDHWGILAVRMDGSASVREITSFPEPGAGSLQDEVPDWSPDGQKIVFERSHFPATKQSDFKLLVISASGVGTVQDTGVSGYVPRWSPDGQKIVFARVSNKQDPFGQIFRQDGISVMDANGSNIQKITSGDADLDFQEATPAWQPTGGAKVEFTQAIQQLQTIAQLKADLVGDGAPPVAIVAGKPLAMRIYLGQVEDTTIRTVEVSGQVTGSETLTLGHICTQENRRRLEKGCRSVDFYFTPPEGAWSVTMRILDENGQQISEDVFNLTSVKTKKVIIKAVSVCDDTDAFGNWLCQDASALEGEVSLLRRMFPTSSVTVEVTKDVIRYRESDLPRTDTWWALLLLQLESLYEKNDKLSPIQGQEVYYYGLTRSNIPGGSLGVGFTARHVGASRVSVFSNMAPYQRASAVVAHEIGHAMGIDHTGTAQPAFSSGRGCSLGDRTIQPAYPYADNDIRSGDAPGTVEVGFDVATRTVITGDKYFEIMGYCETPPPSNAKDITQWITPFSTVSLLGPNGPLAFGPSVPAAAPAEVSDYWLVSGTLDQPTNAILAPLLVISAAGQASPGAGAYRIEVRNGSGGILYTRMFTPAHGHGSPAPSDPVTSLQDGFVEMIPVQTGAASIVILDPFATLIGQLSLEGEAPVVDSIALPGAFSGIQTFSWSVTDSDSIEHTYEVDYTPDGGQTWHHQASGLTTPSLTLDFETLAGSNGHGAIRVMASDGVNSSATTSAAFSVAGKPPHAEIVGPERTSFRVGELVWLEAAAWDNDDGTLDNGSVKWRSNRDGALGTSTSLPVYDLSEGTHTITMTAKDSDGNEMTDSIVVSVFDAPVFEGEAPWIKGDLDCDGDVDSVDALKGLQHNAGIAVAQPDGCPPIGSGDAGAIFGDVDCDDDVDSVDSLSILRKVAGLAAVLPPGCKPIGL